MEKPKAQELKKAVALSYNEEIDQAPKVVAKGSGLVAEQILTLARTHGVPVYQNKALISMLTAVELDREIPPELYKAVAEVLAYVYRVDQALGKRR